jgi:hypothetical protein
MKPDRLKGGRCDPPFPIYEDPVGSLLAAHQSDDSGRDAAVAHILALGAGYAYGDIETMATVMSRAGFAEHASVLVSEVVDAMYIYSTAYLTQSRCGRVVILSYRGTQPANLANWLGDADVESDSMLLGTETVSVHSGFYRNLRATRMAMIDELNAALEGRSLADRTEKVDRPMEALYITGHSLGGALAVLFALSIAATPEHSAIADRLRAVYTFAQPMTLGEPLPEGARRVSRKIFRHVLPRDIVPALPPGGWGHFAHAGHEYRYVTGAWQKQETPVAQLVSIREITRALVSMFAPASRREGSRYSLSEHGPHHYISALRPRGRITEFGDQG